MVSSGGEGTSMSFMGLWACVVAAVEPKSEFVPMLPNIFHLLYFAQETQSNSATLSRIRIWKKNI